MAQLARLRKELEQLANDPGPGVSAWPVEDNMTSLEAMIQGPSDSPFEEGTYTLSVTIPDRYPFEPPRVRFLTPIYHPNIDHDGRICLDTLKMQPQGSWSPSININTVLLTIRMLMQTPNADDGLVPEITEEYKRDVALWRKKALEHTRKNAVPKPAVAAAQPPDLAPAAAAAAPAVPLAAEQPPSALGKRERPDGAGEDDKDRRTGARGGADDNNDEEEDEGFYVT